MSGTSELDALGGLTFNWTRSEQDVWAPPPYHVDGLHRQTAELIRQGIGEAAAGTANPLGIAIQGQRGVGKTHMLGWARQQVQSAGGYFFLVSVASGLSFWNEVLAALMDGLQASSGDERSQVVRLLTDLAQRADLGDGLRDMAAGAVPPTTNDVEAFVAGVRRLDRAVGLTCQDTLRALILLVSPEYDHQDVGLDFLYGNELETDRSRPWRIRSRPKSPRLLIADLSRLLALSGPSVVAVDQIDALIDEIGRAPAADDPGRLVNQVATGLMDLRDKTRRTLTIVACLTTSWEFIQKNAVESVPDRFRPAVQLHNIPSADVGRALIARRFEFQYEQAGFHPPYPTWPIMPAAFDDATRYTVRGLLRRAERHITACRNDGQVRELDRLDDFAEGQATGHPSASAPVPLPQELDELDARYETLLADADVDGAFDHKTEDITFPPLIAAGLDAWISELGPEREAFLRAEVHGQNPAVHAQLVQVIDDETERKRSWAFRAIATDNSRAALNRLRNALKAVPLDGRDNCLCVLRNTRWPTGPTSDREMADFKKAGGTDLTVSGADLRTFAALKAMLAEGRPGLHGWLAARRPAHRTELLERALADAAPRPPATSRAPAPASPMPAGEHVHVGAAAVGGSSVDMPLRALNTHVVIIAGTGSGKTVVLRRLVEECALHGVSSIVIDLNNDLARLGDPWPDPPGQWADGDAERARAYLDGTDVVVWTPRREAGRPLTFHPLPDFPGIGDNPDEFNAAVDAAIGALAPRANVHKPNDRAQRGKAVLTEALRYFGRQGGGDLGAFIDLLTALPDEASSMPRAAITATELAEKLQAARVNDPLFGGIGQAADPGILLTPRPGKRARVSVISMVGLEGEQRLSFVNQLQLALFSWVKRNPARDGLGGLLVMDEAQDLAPAVGTTVSKESTIRLVAQARKYGLGLVFATQAPRSLSNQIPSNAATQLFGRLNSHTQIEAARNVARAKGGDLPDIARLGPGQFYFAGQQSAFRRIETPMCLTHHPPAPLTEEEVIARAQRS